jgi:hypothetical protein
MPPEITSNRALGSTVASSREASDGTAALAVAIVAPDGSHVDGGASAIGEVTDAAVAGDNDGTLEAKLRYLNKVLADVWDSVNHVLKTSASLTGGGGDGALLDGADSGIKATIFDYTNSNPLSVRLTDTNGDYVSPSGASATGAPHHFVAAATTNARSVKASAGTVYRVSILNVADYPVYLKFHNTAGVPTAGAGVVRTVGVQAGTQVVLDLGAGEAFATGIGVTLVKDITDAGTTAVAASDAVVDIDYA